MKHFHAHIYFAPENLKAVRSLAEQVHGSNLFEFVKLHEQKVGPHPTGMIEAHFGEASYVSALEWMNANCRSFSTLIHQDTGDDLKDHTENILWLGPALPLDFAFFELIQMRPDL